MAVRLTAYHEIVPAWGTSRDGARDQIESSRTQTEADNCRNAWVMVDGAEVPHQLLKRAARIPGGDQAERARAVIESFRAEMQRTLPKFDRVDDGNASERADNPAGRVALSRAGECAWDRAERAAADLIRAASSAADLQRDQARADGAAADLLRAVSIHGKFHCARVRARKTAANRLRRTRQLVEFDKERAAIARFRAWFCAKHGLE